MCRAFLFTPRSLRVARCLHYVSAALGIVTAGLYASDGNAEATSYSLMFAALCFFLASKIKG